ncbi:PKD domain-containing protein [Candidatus Peregrinibacteria bacterium]|nr:MAG: PKD domain-containing protein [Candidatus Peregrinibacteria bacterium]
MQPPILPSMRRALLALLSLVLFSSTAFAAGDLSLNASSLQLSADSCLEGHSIRIWVSVSNNSTEDLLGSVRFTANGVQVGSDQGVSALAGKSDEVFLNWTPPSYGTFTLTANLSPWENAGDDPSNNSVSKQVTVGQDTDRDGVANSSDSDDDNDGTPDSDDVFPTNRNENKDSDGDGQGNSADTDDDNDGTSDTEDHLPEDSRYTKDQDGDSIPNELDEDIDGDQVSNEEETAQGTITTEADSDKDLVLDGIDLFPLDETEWADLDADGIGDNSDPDIDNDGILNETDPDPSNPAPEAAVNDSVILTSLDEEVTFDASASMDNNEIVKYTWTFGEEVVEGKTVTHRFEQKGAQVATLTVYDAEGQSDTLEVKVHVFGQNFLVKAIAFSLVLLLLAFYLIYRYNRRASGEKPKKNAKK